MKFTQLLRESQHRRFEAQELLWLLALNDARLGQKVRSAQEMLFIDEELPDALVHWVFEVLRVRTGLQRPLQYVAGGALFRDHYYRVGSGVLCPRLETETWFEEFVTKYYVPQPKSSGIILEFGLGSGILSIECLRLLPHWHGFSTEISEVARACARMNAEFSKVSDRLWISSEPDFQRAVSDFLETTAFATLHSVDLIISNPPYLRGSSEATLDVMLTEPYEALFEDEALLLRTAGLGYYRDLLTVASKSLKPGGALVCEIAHERADFLRSAFLEIMGNVQVIRDVSGRERALVSYG